MTKNQIDYQNYVETRRTNLARETETSRANLTNEELKRRELSENSRHNLSVEGEAKRHNLTTEAETNRSNTANEYLKRQQNAIQSQNVQLGFANLQEQVRANDLRDAQYYAGLDSSAAITTVKEDAATHRKELELKQQNQQYYDKFELDQASTLSKPANLLAYTIGKLVLPMNVNYKTAATKGGQNEAKQKLKQNKR